MGTHLHVLAVACRALADEAVDGGADLGACQVQFGLGDVRPGGGDLCLEALDVGAQGVGLHALGLEVGFGLGQLRAGDAGVGRECGDALFRHVAGLAQGLGAGQVDLGAAQGGLARGDIRLAGRDEAGLLGEFALGLGQFGLAGRQGGLGTLKGDAEVCRLQAHQQVPFLDGLVVPHQYFFYTRAQLTRDPGDFALDIGIVRALQEATDQQPMCEETTDHQHQ